jgi:uncharacterized membrane protein YhhN
MQNTRLLAFVLISVAYLIAKVIEHKTLIFIAKPLLMPTLAIWLAYETQGRDARFLRRAILAGLAFATLGDILLLFTGRQSGALFFMLGLAAFLFTHLFYIGGFLSVADWQKGYLRHRLWWVLPFVVFLVVFLQWLWPGIPVGMKLPVSIYATVITAMVLSVINLKEAIAHKVFWPLLTGALLFMLSDSLIALHKFGSSFPESGIAIMVTYIVGQFLIAKAARDIIAST